MSGEEPFVDVFEEAALTTRWLREPDAWDATFVTEVGDLQIVFHLVALRNENLVWCGYLGYPGYLPCTDEQFRAVESCAHRGECTGALDKDGVQRPRWPGYIYPGFDCGHTGDWSPRADVTSSLRPPTNYRTLEYVQSCLYGMARALAEQVDPELARMLRRADDALDAAEAADWPLGPRPIL